MLYYSPENIRQSYLDGASIISINSKIKNRNPAVKEAKNNNMLITGPCSSDAFFARSHRQKFDAVLAMYHDQGLIPFKTLASGEGVNYTAGLPVVRTSPDHGGCV